MPGPRTRGADASADMSIESLMERVAQLEAALEDRDTASPSTTSAANGDAPRKPKGGPIDDDMRKTLVTKRERLQLARLAEQAAWEDLKVAVRAAAEAGVSYREIGDAIGVTRARVYQIVSGKR
jgi:DNA-directed RNA polymerase specialized sigma24 family protein